MMWLSAIIDTQEKTLNFYVYVTGTELPELLTDK